MCIVKFSSSSVRLNFCLGMLVVNVSWKGKKFVGTLLDATVHEWAPPRYLKFLDFNILLLPVCLFKAWQWQSVMCVVTTCDVYRGSLMCAVPACDVCRGSR